MNLPTVDELNADFNAAYADLHEFVVASIPDRNIPFVGNVRDIALQKIQTPQGRAALLKIVRDVVAADEAWRAAHPQ